MKKILLLSTVVMLSVLSCKNSEKKEQANQEKIETSQNNNQPKEKESLSELNADVQDNILICENKAYSIKIDRLKNEDIRLIAWSKPQKRTDVPNIVLYNGTIEPQGSGGGYHYNFENKGYEYSIENRLMGETNDSIGVFLRVLKDGKQVSLRRMTNLTEKKDNDKVSFTKEDLIGNWWTPHYAPRKVAFDKDGTFLFDEGDGKQLKGTYTIANKTVNLIFSDKNEKQLTLGGGKDSASLTLVGDGENFIKK